MPCGTFLLLLYALLSGGTSEVLVSTTADNALLSASFQTIAKAQQQDEEGKPEFATKQLRKTGEREQRRGRPAGRAPPKKQPVPAAAATSEAKDDGPDDSRTECVSWAASGECEKNPGYMRDACARSCAGKLPAGSIDEGAVEGELKANAGFPEPELVLQCGPEEHLGGLLPWHCRVTQYAHLGPLGAVSEACARRALVEHAGVTQRHGR